MQDIPYCHPEISHILFEILSCNINFHTAVSRCLAKVVIHSLSYLGRSHTNLNKKKNTFSLIFKPFKIYYLNEVFFFLSVTLLIKHQQLLYGIVQYSFLRFIISGILSTYIIFDSLFHCRQEIRNWHLPFLLDLPLQSSFF